MSELFTQAEYAAHRRCSRAAVNKAIKAGRIALTDDGRIDPAVADAAWLRNSRARVHPTSRAASKAPPPGDDVADYSESRARRESAEASLAELALGEANGTLLSRESVERGAFQAARGLRDNLDAAASALGAEVAGLTQASDCETAIRSAHRQLLEDFVREIARMIGPPVEPAPAA